MPKFTYICKEKELHSELQWVFFETESSPIMQIFAWKKSKFFRIKFIFFVCLSIVGFKHYNTMWILGYETFLFDESFAWKKILKQKKKKTLLDIGAGNGSITQIFRKYVEKIYCIEPSPSFQKILQKKWYTVVENPGKGKYDVVTIFNVFDICDNPDELLSIWINSLSEWWLLVISLPFPLCTRSWDNRKIRKTNHLGQKKNTSFEAGVSLVYTDFLRKHQLHVTGFTRLPYIVSLPESQDVSVYDNGLFICQKD